MNIHASNLFRNSFILEENEDEQPDEKMATLADEDADNKLSNSSIEAFDKSFELPFSELVFIDLSDNKVSRGENSANSSLELCLNWTIISLDKRRR